MGQKRKLMNKPELLTVAFLQPPKMQRHPDPCLLSLSLLSRSANDITELALQSPLEGLLLILTSCGHAVLFLGGRFLQMVSDIFCYILLIAKAIQNKNSTSYLQCNLLKIFFGIVLMNFNLLTIWWQNRWDTMWTSTLMLVSALLFLVCCTPVGEWGWKLLFCTEGQCSYLLLSGLWMALWLFVLRFPNLLGRARSLSHTCNTENKPRASSMLGKSSVT